MNTGLLYEILTETTFEYRKGAEVERREVGPLQVAEVYMMPHVSAAPDTQQIIDVEFMEIGVDVAKAQAYREPLIGLLNAYPHPDRLAGGPSYIEVGAVIGSQGAALQLFALGKALGLWDIITPAKMGLSGAEARELAGSGFVMITGYRSTAEAA